MVRRVGSRATVRAGSVLRGAVLLVLAGCTTIRADEHGRSHVLVGVVRVVVPEREGRLAAIEVRTLGAGWDNGPFLGWHSGNWIVADPADCQLLVVIRSPAQAANAEKVLRALEGQKPCVADYTRPRR